MKKYFLLSILSLSSFLINAQIAREWATYYGGSGDEDLDAKVATDAFGNVYLAGTTSSSNAIAFNGFQNTLGGVRDAFLAKFDSTGILLWATYYGSAGNDFARAIAVDPSGFVYIAGSTAGGAGFASGGFQTVFGGGTDAFLVKFDANGNRVWSTYYGGANADDGYGVCVDGLANVYLSGTTQSNTGIASGGFDNTLGGTTDGFLVKFDGNGSRIWATYYGGSAFDAGYDVAADGSDNVYLSGYANSTTGIASGGFQNTHGGSGSSDAFLVKFDPSGARLWATYYGGSASESALTVVTDASDNVFICGNTMSPGLAAGGFQNTIAGNADAYLVKFNSAGARLWATYYGGINDEFGEDLATDLSGNVYLFGSTNSGSGIASGGFQNTYGGSLDAYLVKFDSMGNRIAASYYGNALDDIGHGGTVDPNGAVYFSGVTLSITGISAGGYQNTYGGGSYDTYLVKFYSCQSTPAAPGTISGNLSVCEASSNTYTISTVSGASSYTWNLPAGWSGTSTTNSITVTAGPNSGTISVTANNGCGSSSASSLLVSSIAIPGSPGTISGLTTICAGSTQTYSTSVVAGATSYTWTLPSGWSGASTSNSITVTPNATGGTISVTADNSCGSSALSSLPVTVNDIPSTPGSISGAATICEGSNNTYSISLVAGATSYTWVLPSGWSGSSTSNSISATASVTSGNITVTANNSCGISPQATLAITVNSLPAVSLTLTVDTLCFSSSLVPLSGGSPSGGTFSGIGVSGGNFNPSVSGNGSFVITYTFTDANSCTNTATDNIVVDPCLGINKQNEQAIQIYPSPTTGNFTLVCPSFVDPDVAAVIYNAVGESILTLKISSPVQQVDLSHVPAGIYFIRISTGNKIFVEKIIKQ